MPGQYPKDLGKGVRAAAAAAAAVYILFTRRKVMQGIFPHFGHFSRRIRNKIQTWCINISLFLLTPHFCATGGVGNPCLASKLINADRSIVESTSGISVT